MSNLYAERDIIEQGDHYSRHVSAMTGEGLHSKSAIAAELAHRDIQLEQAHAEIKQLKQANFTKGDLAIEWKVKLDKAQAKVAELEELASKRPNAHDRDLRIEYALWADGIGSSSCAYILRKQAEAVEQVCSDIGEMVFSPEVRTPQGALCKAADHCQGYAKRLRQQADDTEKAGGEQ